ncbi:MAG: hypothetical protein H0V67_06800 [Geodermatophilaceae bacterium]|nr:hypothetical protein [Geodermatophilaceae bacterium]
MSATPVAPPGHPRAAHAADMLIGQGRGDLSPSHPLLVAGRLGRLEGRRALTSTAAVFVVVVAFVAWVLSREGASSEDDWWFAVLLDSMALLVGLGALLLLNLAATRERRNRAGELLDAAPGAPTARIGGVLVSALVPATAMLLLTIVLGPLAALVTGFDVGDPEVSPLRGDGPVGLLILGRHAELVLLGGTLGVALGMWVPRLWVAVLAIPPLFVLGIYGMWGVGGDHAWLAPNANQLSIRSAHDYACEVDRLCLQFEQPLGQFTSYWHLIYVAGLCGIFAALALLRRSRSWRVLLFGGLSLAASLGMGLALVG